MVVSKSLAKVLREMEINIDKDNKDPTLIKLQFLKTPTEVINAIRRSIFNTDTMRIDELIIHPETNIHSDNFSHNIGQVPLENYNPNDFIYPYELYDDYYENQWKYQYISDHQLTERRGSGICGRPDRPKHSEIFQQLLPDPDERCVLRFDLDIECQFDPKTKQVVHQIVFGSDVKWIPIGQQQTKLAQNNPLKFPQLKPNDVIATLVIGQRLKYTFYAWKGNANIMSKWRGCNVITAPFENEQNSWNMTIKSLDTLPPQYYLTSAFKTLIDETHQLQLLR